MMSFGFAPGLGNAFSETPSRLAIGILDSELTEDFHTGSLDPELSEDFSSQPDLLRNGNEADDSKDAQKHYYDDSGKEYRTGNDLLPNNTYEINGYHYATDADGRITSAEGILHMKDRDGRLPIRDSIEEIGKGDQKEADQRGHLIGDQFDGSNGLENMVPQDADINMKDFRYFENDLADQVKAGKEVYVKVEPIYEGDSRRPDAIGVSYSIDGNENYREFPNYSGGSL